MKKSKLIIALIASSVMISVAGISLYANNKEIKTSNMALSRIASENGKNVKISINNIPDLATSFNIRLKIDGDVKYSKIEFSNYIKEHATTDIKYNEQAKEIDIYVTSKSNLVKDGELEVGNLYVDGKEGTQYSVIDVSKSGMPSFLAVTDIYDEVSAIDLANVGDDKIVVGKGTVNPPQPPTDPEPPTKPEPPKPPINPPTQIPIELTDIKGHWAELTIKDFVKKGYIKGYEDKTFKPNNSITRAEFVKILNNYFGLSKTSQKVFEDTKNHWAKIEIDIAVTNKVCNGKSKTEFKPNDPITREEAASMISNYRKIADKNHDKLNKYIDNNKVSTWAKNSVEGILEKEYMNGYEDKTFRPKNNITRAEAVVTLSRIN